MEDISIPIRRTHMLPEKIFLVAGWARRRIPDLQSSHRTTHRLVSAIIKIDFFQVCIDHFNGEIPLNETYIACGRGTERKDKSKTQPVSNLIAQ